MFAHAEGEFQLALQCELFENKNKNETETENKSNWMNTFIVQCENLDERSNHLRHW